MKGDAMNGIRAMQAMLPLIMIFAVVSPAAAMQDGPYSMEILVNGVPLEEHSARGSTYVEALENREYVVRLRNRSPERIAVALSIDGLNSIDAKTTDARTASKWIIEPYGTIAISGWQTASSTARHFFFTTERDSYGAWLGRSENLGIVSAAFFRERRRRPPAPRRERKCVAESPSSRSGLEAEGLGLSDDMAATGIGRRINHPVRSIEFKSESRPAVLLELRYEYHDTLVRLGILPPAYARHEDPLLRRERARGFENMDFAPDPDE
jgi:hypothetical protein